MPDMISVSQKLGLQMNVFILLQAVCTFQIYFCKAVFNYLFFWFDNSIYSKRDIKLHMPHKIWLIFLILIINLKLKELYIN